MGKSQKNIAIKKENVPAENKDETIVKILITSKPGELWTNLEVLANGSCISDDIIFEIIKVLSEVQQFLVDNKAKLRKGDATEIGWGFYEV